MYLKYYVSIDSVLLVNLTQSSQQFVRLREPGGDSLGVAVVERSAHRLSLRGCVPAGAFIQ